VQHLWLSLKKEKESQEKNNKKENQEGKEIACPRMPLTGIQTNQSSIIISNSAQSRNGECIVSKIFSPAIH